MNLEKKKFFGETPPIFGSGRRHAAQRFPQLPLLMVRVKDSDLGRVRELGDYQSGISVRKAYRSYMHLDRGRSGIITLNGTVFPQRGVRRAARSVAPCARGTGGAES